MKYWCYKLGRNVTSSECSNCDSYYDCEDREAFAGMTVIGYCMVILAFFFAVGLFWFLPEVL